MARHVMTPKRRLALRKAQLASARKRRKNYRSAVQQHKVKAIATYRRGGGTSHARKAALKQYDANVVASKHRILGRKKASVRRQRNYRRARNAASYATTAVTISTLVAPGATVAVAGHAIRSGVKGAKYGRAAAHAAPHAARGFKRGYKMSRARNAAAKRNMKRANFGHATAHRVPMAALPRGTGHSSYAYAGRRVRHR